MEKNFEKLNEWAGLLDRLSILWPTGLLYSTKTLQEHPDNADIKEAKRMMFDDIAMHYENFMKIAKSTTKRNTKAELQNEFVAVMAGESKAAISGAVELIRRRLNLVIYQTTEEEIIALPFFADCVTYGVASMDEVQRLAFRMVAAARYRNVLCNQIKEAYTAFLENGGQRPEVAKLPKELDTDEAKTLLNRLFVAGYCDGAYKWVSGTAYQAAQAAYNIGAILWKCNKWKPFETYWGLANMAQTFAKNRLEAKQKDINDIDMLFPENNPPKIDLVKL